MSLLLVVGHPDASPILTGLAAACARRGQVYQCFFTGDGVRALTDAGVRESAAQAERAVVCEHSWDRYFAGEPPPVERGSQTDHSAMVGQAARVVSL